MQKYNPKKIYKELEEIDGEGWKTIIDFTKIRKGGVPIEEVIKASHALDKVIAKKKKS